MSEHFSLHGDVDYMNFGHISINIKEVFVVISANRQTQTLVGFEVQ